MSKLDREKEKIGVLKFWLGVVVAVFLGVASWLINNLQKADTQTWLIVGAEVGLVCLFLVGILLSRALNRCVENLKDL